MRDIFRVFREISITDSEYTGCKYSINPEFPARWQQCEIPRRRAKS